MRKILIIVPVCLLFFWSFAYASSDGVRINQIQVEGDGGANDEFIEVYNPTSSPISLDGWSVQYRSASGATYSKKNLPPDAIIGPNNYYLIARSGYNGLVLADHTHSSFSLSGSSSGALVFLVSSTTTLTSDTDSSIVDMLSYSNSTVPTSENSLMRTGELGPSNPRNSTYVTALPSPTPRPVVDVPTNPVSFETYSSDIIISEIFPNPDGKDDGEEWIELFNNSEKDIDLGSWVLDDGEVGSSIGNDAYTFSETAKIKSKSYFVVHLSDENFALANSGEETVRLFWPNQTFVSKVYYTGTVKVDESYAIKPSGLYEWTNAVTPGAMNKSTAVALPVESNGEDIKNTVVEEVLADILITEIFPEPSKAGGQEEFIELFNAGESEADLRGYKLSDNAGNYTLDAVIPAREFMVIYKSESKLALNNSGNETVTLFSSQGTEIASVNYEDSPADQSLNLRTDESYAWSVSLTPGKTNTIRTKVAKAAVVKTAVAQEPAIEEDIGEVPVEAEPISAQITAPLAFASELVAGEAVENNFPTNSQQPPLWPWLLGSFATNLVFCYSLVRLMTRKGNV